MDSKEFGLVAVQQLFQVEDLHYGYWGKGETPLIADFQVAQDRYTRFLLKYIEQAVNFEKQSSILDVGCGTGVITRRLLKLGYRVDGLVPSAWMAQQAREKIRPYRDEARGEIHECRLEDFSTTDRTGKYALAFFSESFQYVDMQKAFGILNTVLDEGGTVVIFDFFKKDGVDGKSPFGGGHSIGEFYETVASSGYTIQTDLDVTENLSPNIALVNDILVNRVIPFTGTLDTFLSARYGFLYSLLKCALGNRLEKMKTKYSRNRDEANFIKYKTYRLFVLKRDQ
jgi:ubiquinone/menaquinone biosynthesis C-methylase UbiE